MAGTGRLWLLQAGLRPAIRKAGIGLAAVTEELKGGQHGFVLVQQGLELLV